MALKESLDGVSSALSGILKQLKDIEEAQKRIKTNASAYQAAVSGAAAGTGGVGASGGVMDGSLGNVPAASGAPAGAPAGSPGGTPSWASAALGRVVGGGGVGGTLAGLGLGLGAIAIDTAWNMTPGAQDYLAFQTPLFQTARFGPNGYDPTVKDRVQRLFGPYMTSNTDALAAAQLATMRGQGISSGVFNFQARQAASISMLTGMSNPQAMSAATSMYMGNTSGNLARYGIFTNSLRTGRPKDLGAIVDELWARWLGSANAKISMEELNAQLMGGFIGNDLRNLFGNDPQLYETMYNLILQKGQQKGASVRLSRTSGAGSAIEASKAFGNNRRNNPALGLMEMSSERYATIATLTDELATGFEFGVDTVKKLNDAMQYLADSASVLGSMFRGLVTTKSAMETILGTTEGSGAAGGLGSLLPFLGGMAASRMLGRGGRGGAAGGRHAKGAKTSTKPAPGKHAKPAAAASRGIGSVIGGVVSTALAAPLLSDAINIGNDAWGKDQDELGVTWSNPAGLAKGFGNVMARAGAGALEGLMLTRNPFGAAAGAVLEGGYGIYQGFTDPYFGVKGHETPTVLGGLINSILGGFFSGGTIGGTGSSTSDTIRANLSKGEYVVNARAAQKIGTQNLDALNSLGHDFGSAFASPARNFASGGTTLDGWPALSSDSDLMSTYTVPGAAGSYLIRKDYAPMLLNVIKGYNSTVRKIEEGYGWRGGDAYYGNGITNHAAGVAVDFDYNTYWGYPGSAKDPTPSEMKAIRALLAANPGIEWGGDWDKPTWYDPMHFEVRDPNVKASTTTGVPAGPGDAPATRKEKSAASRGMTGAAPAPLNILSGASLLSPAASAVGGTTGYLTGYSLPGLGNSNALQANFTTSAPISARLSAITSRLGGSGIMGGSGSTSSTTRSGKQTGGTRSSINLNDAPTGKGPAWLYQFLVDHGLRGKELQTAWTIGMRESGGDPSNTTNGGTENWTFSGSPHYDVGVFQINNRHLDAIRQMFGNDADMSLMLDPNKNFEYMMRLSKNLTSLYAWALEPDGKTFNWDVSYGGRDNYRYADSAESNHMTFWNQYSKYNKYNYSQGAYRTHEGMAKLHEGEMVLPASAAEEFRRALKDFAGGRSAHGDVHITLKIEKASDAEAERFAKKVKKLLEDDDRLSSMRKH